VDKWLDERGRALHLSLLDLMLQRVAELLEHGPRKYELSVALRALQRHAGTYVSPHVTGSRTASPEDTTLLAQLSKL
jgi:hypothetical protein